MLHRTHIAQRATCSTDATVAKVQALSDVDNPDKLGQLAPAGPMVANTFALAEVVLEKPLALTR